MSTVTIVTRTHHRPLLLARAVESVLAQTYQDWEHIIVNDGGPREAVEAVVTGHRKAYSGRVKTVHLPKSVGMQEAANRGIGAGRGTFLCLHDDDDTWAPAFLAEAVGFLESAGTGSPYQGVIARTELIEEQVNEENEIVELSRRPYIPLGEISLFRVGFENPFPPIAFCFRRTAYEAIGPFDPRFNVAGDYDFNFRFLRRFEIGVLPGILAQYRIRRQPRERAEGNSVELDAREHKLRYNEIKNHYLREARTEHDAALALAFNLSRYLVEIEWVTHETRKRAEALQSSCADESRLRQKAETEQRAEQENLRRELLERLDEACTNLRDALTSRIDGLRKTGEQHASNLWSDLNHRARESLAAQERIIALLNDGVSPGVETLRERIESLAEDHHRATRDLWTDLNARGRENSAATEAAAGNILQTLGEVAERQAAAIEEVRQRLAGAIAETQQAAKAEQVRTEASHRAFLDALAAAEQRLQAAGEREAQRQAVTLATQQQAQEESLAALQQAQQGSLSALQQAQAESQAAAREAQQRGFDQVSARLGTLAEDLEQERNKYRPLLSIGPLQLVWKRRSAAPAVDSSAEASE